MSDLDTLKKLTARLMARHIIHSGMDRRTREANEGCTHCQEIVALYKTIDQWTTYVILVDTDQSGLSLLDSQGTDLIWVDLTEETTTADLYDTLATLRSLPLNKSIAAIIGEIEDRIQSIEEEKEEEEDRISGFLGGQYVKRKEGTKAFSCHCDRSTLQ